MENIIVYPPNKQFERTLGYSEVPVINKHLFFLDFNEEGEIILGSSSVSSTLWEGSLFTFSTSQTLVDQKFSGFYIGNTASDGKFLNNKQVALAEDTGNLRILNIDEKLNISGGISFKHYYRIPQLAVWRNTSNIITCSGSIIAIFDINATKNPQVHHWNVHTEYINSVDTLQSHPNVFTSAGADRKALLWDSRNAEPVTVLYSNDLASLTSIAWNPENEHSIVVGSEAGDLYLLDTREPNNFIEFAHCFDRNIHRIAFNNSNHVAVCGDLNEVVILDNCEQNLKVIYRNQEHKGIVRGLAWHSDSLYSCGFDKQIVKHLV